MELTASYEKMLEKLNAEIWDFAELKFNEVKSAAAMTELLEKEGFRVTRGLAICPQPIWQNMAAANR